MNKQFLMILLLSLFLQTSCKSKGSSNGSSGSNNGGTCNVLDGNTGSNQCGDGQPNPTDPFDPTTPGDGGTDPIDPPPVDQDFEVVSNYPVDLENNFHVDDTIEIQFNRDVDKSNIIINSGNALDIISLRDGEDNHIHIDISWSGRSLFIKSRHSLVPNQQYNLAISNEIQDSNGEYLNGNFYLTFYTEGDPVNPGTDIEVSWDYVEENFLNNHTNYTLGYDVKSRFNEDGIVVRDYDHKHNFTAYDPEFYYDSDLDRNFYTLELNLLKGAEYFFALKVCNEIQTNLCSEYSNEVATDIP